MPPALLRAKARLSSWPNASASCTSSSMRARGLEVTEEREAPPPEGPGEHDEDVVGAEPRRRGLAAQKRKDTGLGLDGLAVVTGEHVDEAQAVARLRLERDVTESCGKLQGRGPRPQRAIRRSHPPVGEDEQRHDPAKAEPVVELPGCGLGFREELEPALESPQHGEPVVQLEAEVDGRFDRIPRDRQVAERDQRLLEGGGRFQAGVSLPALGPLLTAVRERLLPELRLEGVIGKSVDVLGEPLRMEHLDYLDEPPMQCPALRVFQALVRNLLGQGVSKPVHALLDAVRFME